MIIALVQFRLPAPMTVAQAREVFASTAPRYRDLPGLIRKHYVLTEDGRTAGGDSGAGSGGAHPGAPVARASRGHRV